MATEEKEELRVVKTAPRKYRVTGETEDGDEIQELVSPAEYAVLRGERRLASVVKTGDGWRVCEPTENSKLGLAVSPVGLDSFRRVKTWALNNYA